MNINMFTLYLSYLTLSGVFSQQLCGKKWVNEGDSVTVPCDCEGQGTEELPQEQGTCVPANYEYQWIAHEGVYRCQGNPDTSCDTKQRIIGYICPDGKVRNDDTCYNCMWLTVDGSLHIETMSSHYAGVYTCGHRRTALSEVYIWDIQTRVPPSDVSINLRTEDIMENDDVTVTCSVPIGTNPAAGVHLYVIREAATGVNYRGEPGLSTDITLQLNRSDHNKNVYCQIEWEYDENTYTSAGETVNVFYWPLTITFTSDVTEDFTCSECDVTLTCTTSDANPDPVLTMSHDTGTYSDTGHNIQKEVALDRTHNQRPFICQSFWDKSDVTKELTSDNITFTVTFATNPIMMTTLPMPIEETDDLYRIYCNVSEANPAAILTWARNGNLITPTEYREESGEYNSKTVITWQEVMITREENGNMYTCTADNYPDMEERRTISIAFGPDECSLTASPSPWFPEGSKQTFECWCSTSNPLTLVSWLLVTEDGVVEQNLTDNATTYYSPGAYNGDTTSSHLTLHLTRQFNQKTLRCTTTKTWADQLDFNISYRHLVTVEVTNNNAVEGSDITLTCEAQGGNPPSVSSYYWSFSSKLSDFQPQFDCISAKCKLHGVHHIYAGTYTCTGTNGWGGEEGRDSVNVEVLYSPVTDMEHVTPEKSYTAGDDISLPCHFFSYPDKPYITWYQQIQGDLDEHQVDESQITTVRDGTDRYTSTVTLYAMKHNMTVTCRGEDGGSARGHRSVSDYYQYWVSVYEPDVPEPTNKAISPGVIVGCALATLAVGFALGLGTMFHYQRRQKGGDKGYEQDAQVQSHPDTSPHYYNREDHASPQDEGIAQDVPISVSPHYDELNIISPQYEHNPHDGSTPISLQHDTAEKVNRLPHYANLPVVGNAYGENPDESTHSMETTTYQQLLTPGFVNDNPPTYEDLQLDMVA